MEDGVVPVVRKKVARADPPWSKLSRISDKSGLSGTVLLTMPGPLAPVPLPRSGSVCRGFWDSLFLEALRLVA